MSLFVLRVSRAGVLHGGLAMGDRAVFDARFGIVSLAAAALGCQKIVL